MKEINRKRYIVIRDDNEIFCGLARKYNFKPFDEIKNTAIKTYVSETRAKSSFFSSWSGVTEEDFENGKYKVIAVDEIIKEHEETIITKKIKNYKWITKDFDFPFIEHKGHIKFDKTIFSEASDTCIFKDQICYAVYDKERFCIFNDENEFLSHSLPFTCLKKDFVIHSCLFNEKEFS